MHRLSTGLVASFLAANSALPSRSTIRHEPMSEESKVVSFPRAKGSRQNKTDADHVSNVRKAWRALSRAIADARNFGLTVEINMDIHAEPRISRHYKGR
jgi:hypothetical protein